MKKFLENLSRTVFLTGCILLLVCTTTLRSENRFTSNDPYPVFIAANPLALFTYWEDCEPEIHCRLGLSAFRQRADAARRDPFFLGSCPTTTCVNCDKVCNKDTFIGNIHGPWNMIALLYSEENGNSTVRNNLIAGLNLLDPATTGVTLPNIQSCLATISLPSRTDPDQEFGFFDVPVQYRKYGIRLEADIGTCWDIGVRIQTGLATIRQNVDFVDLTCASSGENCKVVVQEDGSCTTQCCLINGFSCDCKKVVINGIMKQLELAVQKTSLVTIDETATNVEMLDLNINSFCDTDIENINLALYWSRCYNINADTNNPCYPEYTIAPFAIGEVSAPLSKSRDPNVLFQLPFGLDRHWGFSFTGGFNINFVETIQIGFDAGFTRFSDDLYCRHPVPTHDLQQGIYPRKADLNIRPGTVWSFGATMAASHFLSCLSTSIQYRLLHKCADHICVIRPIPMQSVTDTPDDFVASNIKVKKMERESAWTSSFVNVTFDYNISDNVALGFFWQAPVSQTGAYRPTTVMGSLILQY